MREDIQHFWELLWAMTGKELRVRYKYTLFGFLWMIVNPLLQMIVIYSIFSFFMKESIPHYPYYLFIGLLIWTFFSQSLAKTTPSFVHERGLIKKAKFPLSVIPLSIIFSHGIHFFLGLLLVSIPIAFLQTYTSVTLPFLFIGLLLLFLFTIGCGLLCSTLNIRFRDVTFFVQALLMIWFYATPIIYTPSQLPQRLHILWQINPMTSIVLLFEHAFLGTPLPSWENSTINSIIIILLFFSSIWIFQKEKHTFDDWI